MPPLPRRHCRRLVDHPGHPWFARAQWPYEGRKRHWCTGHIVIEGGHR